MNFSIGHTSMYVRAVYIRVGRFVQYENLQVLLIKNRKALMILGNFAEDISKMKKTVPLHKWTNILVFNVSRYTILLPPEGR